jgi:hypothetical protein
MPWETVTLKAPYEDCETGGGGVGIGEGEGDPPTYPSATFERRSCCYVAEFDFGCQPWIFDCHLWVKQNFSTSYSIAEYDIKTAYASSLPATECPCIQTQDTDYTNTQIVRLFAINRRKLKKITVSVGKVLVKCAGDTEATCKYYVASTWEFDANAAAYGGLGIVTDSSYNSTTISCTGVYRQGFCSYTDTTTTTSGTISDACPESVDADWFDDNPSIFYQFKVSRIKLYDALPTTPVSITDADEPPVSCCGGETGCELEIDPCGLNLVDNCYKPLANWSDQNLNPLLFCQTFDENGNLIIECPTILSKEGLTIKSQAYKVDGSGCSSTCIGDTSYLCEDDYPGVDRLICGYTLDEDGNSVPVEYPLATGSCGDPYEFCTVEGCASAGGDCYVYTAPNCNIAPALEDCPDLARRKSAGGGNDTCQRDITDLVCTIGEPVVNNDWEICFTLPTVTLEFA